MYACLHSGRGHFHTPGEAGVYLSIISFYKLSSAAAMETNKQHYNEKSMFLIYLWSLSTGHLDAHSCKDLCTMD